jgi:hypothetical protein
MFQSNLGLKNSDHARKGSCRIKTRFSPRPEKWGDRGFKNNSDIVGSHSSQKTLERATHRT